mmetsp:Transcript_161184/g.517449  ORF Transcript_161184/g.517449 Transcript_161184/m.517449 type:complete len:209 (+) Transcript_161184:2755-3381(+)
MAERTGTLSSLPGSRATTTTVMFARTWKGSWYSHSRGKPESTSVPLQKTAISSGPQSCDVATCLNLSTKAPLSNESAPSPPPSFTLSSGSELGPPPPPTTTPAAEDEAAQEGSRVKRSREVRGDKLMLLTWRSALSCLGPGNQLSPRSHWYTSLACTTGVVARVASKRRLTSPGDVQTYPGSLTLHWTVSLIVASGVSSSSSGSNSSL